MQQGGPNFLLEHSYERRCVGLVNTGERMINVAAAGAHIGNYIRITEVAGRLETIKGEYY